MEEEVFTLEEIEDKLIKFVEWKGKIESGYDIEDFLNFMQNERGCNRWKGRIELDYDIEDFLNFMQNERGCNK